MGLSLRKKALFLAIACMPLSVVRGRGWGDIGECGALRLWRHG